MAGMDDKRTKDKFLDRQKTMFVENRMVNKDKDKKKNTFLVDYAEVPSKTLGDQKSGL